MSGVLNPEILRVLAVYTPEILQVHYVSTPLLPPEKLVLSNSHSCHHVCANSLRNEIGLGLSIRYTDGWSILQLEVSAVVLKAEILRAHEVPEAFDVENMLLASQEVLRASVQYCAPWHTNCVFTCRLWSWGALDIAHVHYRRASTATDGLNCHLLHAFVSPSVQNSV